MSVDRGDSALELNIFWINIDAPRSVHGILHAAMKLLSQRSCLLLTADGGTAAHA